MSNPSGNSNAQPGSESNANGGRIRVQREPERVKAPPQTRMVSRFKQPQLPGKPFKRTTPTIGSTLPLDSFAAKHIEPVQRAEAEDAQQSEDLQNQTETPAQVLPGSAGGDGAGDQPIENGGDGQQVSRQTEAEIAPKVQRMEEEAPSVAKSEAPAEEAAQPQTETEISPQGEADTDVQAQPQGAHRTRGDPNISPKTTYIQKSGKSQVPPEKQ